jgi:hypothetical protein
LEGGEAKMLLSSMEEDMQAGSMVDFVGFKQQTWGVNQAFAVFFVVSGLELLGC